MSTAAAAARVRWAVAAVWPHKRTSSLRLHRMVGVFAHSQTAVQPTFHATQAHAVCFSVSFFVFRFRLSVLIMQQQASQYSAFPDVDHSSNRWGYLHIPPAFVVGMVSAAKFYGVIHASGIPLLCLWFEVFFDFVLFFMGFSMNFNGIQPSFLGSHNSRCVFPIWDKSFFFALAVAATDIWFLWLHETFFVCGSHPLEMKVHSFCNIVPLMFRLFFHDWRAYAAFSR